MTEAGKSFMPQPIDEDPGKPVHIWTRTGSKPLLAGREREPVWRPAGWHDWRPLGAGVSAWRITGVKDFGDCPPAEGEARDRGTDGPRRA
jgi:hypothetical protein